MIFKEEGFYGGSSSFRFKNNPYNGELYIYLGGC